MTILYLKWRCSFLNPLYMMKIVSSWSYLEHPIYKTLILVGLMKIFLCLR
jgi:hypothetical protein